MVTVDDIISQISIFIRKLYEGDALYVFYLVLMIIFLLLVMCGLSICCKYSLCFCCKRRRNEIDK